MPLIEFDIHQLQQAKQILENPGLAVRISNTLGTPVEKGLSYLPDDWQKMVGKITRKALTKASNAAVFTLNDIPGEDNSNSWHKVGAALSGGVGGFFGVAAIAFELPLSTTIIMRSIADIARSEGEEVTSIETKMACLEVFAMGGKTSGDDAAESAYYAVRYALAKSVTDASEMIATKGLSEEIAPLMVSLISKIAERFGVQVTQKAAAQAIPAIGAAGGSIINTLFIDHFQDMAKGHFTIRKLERIYGEDEVKSVYDSLPGGEVSS